MADDLKAVRVKIALRLADEGCESEAVKLLACGSPLDLICSCCAKGRRVAQACRRKWCPECERIRSAEITDLYRPLIEAMRWPLFLTLTMPHTATDDIGENLERLRGGWKRLRGLAWFRRCVRGGVGAIEVSMPEETTMTDETMMTASMEVGHNGAHPHIHALLDCRWLLVSGSMPTGPNGSPQFKHRATAIQGEIAAQWALCLGLDRAGVFTRRAKPGTVAEVLKYAVSSGALLDCRIELRSLIEAMKGRKSVMPFGSIRKALKVVRAEKQAANPPLICECGAEEWRLDPMAAKVTNTLTGQWLTPHSGYIRHIPWGDRDPR